MEMAEMNSFKKQSRIAALLYFVNGLPAPFALLYVPRVLIVRGDATATANNVRDSAALLRPALGVLSPILGLLIFDAKEQPSIATLR